MKNLFLTIAVLLTISSCSFLKEVPKHASVEVVPPKNKFQPLTVTAKFWDMADLAKKYAPKKFEEFIVESEKYCTVRITKFPTSGNDTLAIQLKCDTASERIAGIFNK